MQVVYQYNHVFTNVLSGHWCYNSDMLSYEIITEIPQWDELKTEWNNLLDNSQTHVPFLRHEFLREWWDTRGGGEWETGDLLVITARDGDQLVGIAPLFLNHCKTGKLSLMFIGSFEIVDYLDFIVRPEYLEMFLRGLFTLLGTPDVPQWDQLDLYNILHESPSLPALEKVSAEFGWGYHSEVLQKSPRIFLPGDWETYLAGIDKKQRHEIRRKMRRAESGPVPVAWYVLTDQAKLEEDTQAFLDLMAQDEEKARFLTQRMREQMANTIRCAYDTGCLHLAFLTVDGVKAAAYLSFDYINHLWVYNSGINNSLVEYSPGWVLLGYLLKWANENGYTEFDFMRGDEEYKYRFGAVDRYVCRAVIVKP